MREDPKGMMPSATCDEPSHQSAAPAGCRVNWSSHDMASARSAPRRSGRVEARQGQSSLPDVLRRDVPIGWLEAASRLPGKSLHAGVALWYAAGLTRSRVIPLSNLAGHRFGLDRNAKYRALTWLEMAGLIVVERSPGRAPLVTLLDPGGARDGET